MKYIKSTFQVYWYTDIVYGPSVLVSIYKKGEEEGFNSYTTWQTNDEKGRESVEKFENSSKVFNHKAMYVDNLPEL